MLNESMMLANISDGQITGIKWEKAIEILNAFIGNCDPFDDSEAEMMAAYIELIGILASLCLAHGYIDAETEAKIGVRLARMVEGV